MKTFRKNTKDTFKSRQEIKVINKLSDVEFPTQLPERVSMVRDLVKERLAKHVTGKYGIRLSHDGEIDTIRFGTTYGFGFAISKFDPNFRKPLEGTEFRYMDQEVKAVLKTIIHELDLVHRIDWDRGMGVFVYNIWLREEDLV